MSFGGSMILVNNRKYETFKEGMTIQEVMDEMGYTYPRIVVKVNGKLIRKKDYTTTTLKKGDDVKMHHLLAGG